MTAAEPPSSNQDLEAAPRVEADEQDRPREDRRGEETFGSFLRELPVLVFVAFALAFLLRTFVVQVFYIPSSSMEPTLQVYDRILVDKVTYRLRDLRRGEIVVFEGEPTPEFEESRGPAATIVRGLGQLIGIAPANARDYVKRVIGLPGDVVRIDPSGTVFVNDQPIDEPYAVEGSGDYGPVTVPEGHLFFLGDNRPNSSDSRSTLGFVEQDQIVGRAFVVIWPLDRVQVLHRPDYPVPAALVPLLAGQPSPSVQPAA